MDYLKKLEEVSTQKVKAGYYFEPDWLKRIMKDNAKTATDMMCEIKVEQAMETKVCNFCKKTGSPIYVDMQCCCADREKEEDIKNLTEGFREVKNLINKNQRNNKILQSAYKNKKQTGIIGWLICTVKGWNIWHEETVFPVMEGKPWSNKVVTADNKKGVCDREAVYSHPDRWSFIDVPGYSVSDLDKMWEHYLKHKHQGYAYLDIFWNLIVPTKWNDPKEWFCDEICRHLKNIKPEAVGAPRSKIESIEYRDSYYRNK